MVGAGGGIDFLPWLHVRERVEQMISMHFSRTFTSISISWIEWIRKSDCILHIGCSPLSVVPMSGRMLSTIPVRIHVHPSFLPSKQNPWKTMNGNGKRKTGHRYWSIGHAHTRLVNITRLGLTILNIGLFCSSDWDLSSFYPRTRILSSSMPETKHLLSFNFLLFY